MVLKKMKYQECGTYTYTYQDLKVYEEIVWTTHITKEESVELKDKEPLG